MTSDELGQRLKEKSDSLIAFRLQQATGAVDNVRAARESRRDIARIKTILRQREIAASGGNK
jgi:large subunit ribosomal protein L29